LFSVKKKQLSEIIEIEILSLKHRQKVNIRDIFIRQEIDDVVCSICSEANASPVLKSGMSGN
jgi:hypothetical protein